MWTDPKVKLKIQDGKLVRYEYSERTMEDGQTEIRYSRTDVGTLAEIKELIAQG